MPRVGRVLTGASEALRLERGEILAQPEVSEEVQLTTDLERVQPWSHFATGANQSSALDHTWGAIYCPPGVLIYDLRVRVQLGVAGVDALRWGIDTGGVAWANIRVPGPVTTLDTPTTAKVGEHTSSEVVAEKGEVTNANWILVNSIPSYEAQHEMKHVTNGWIDLAFPVFGNKTALVFSNDTATDSIAFSAWWSERPKR